MSQHSPEERPFASGNGDARQALHFTDDQLQIALVALIHYQQQEHSKAKAEQGALFAQSLTCLSGASQIISKLTHEILRRHQAEGIRQANSMYRLS